MHIMSPRPQIRMTGRAQDKKNDTPNAPDEQGRSIRPDNSWRWILLVLMAVVALMIVVPNVTSKKYKSITYTQFLAAVQSKNPTDQIQSASIDNATGVITGEFRTIDGKTRGSFRAEGPLPPTEDQT